MNWLKYWKPILAIVLAIGLYLGGLFVGHHREAVKNTATTAKAEVKAQKQITHRAEVRSHVEQQTAALPDAPVQRIGDADPGTAAGKLRAWTRD
jgi:uncharacterized membrane-anchored protein YhcB (DUF1043 family)